MHNTAAQNGAVIYSNNDDRVLLGGATVLLIQNNKALQLGGAIYLFTNCDWACDNRACGHMIFAYFFTLSSLITFCTITLWHCNFQLSVSI